MINHSLIKIGSSGDAVEKWQYFLAGLGLYKFTVDGDFGARTHDATLRFQQSNGLKGDGVVGKKTYDKAMEYGFDSGEKTVNKFPKKPNFSPLSQSQKDSIFGKFTFSPNPTHNNPEGITIHGDWVRNNIVMLDVPQLAKATHNKFRRMQFHVKAKDQLLGLFAAWEKAKLLDRILSYGGSFNPRFIRGSRTVLSNHATGTAFDINMQWNGLGRIPAKTGKRGCVYELVGIANDFGFYWGGHFSYDEKTGKFGSRSDGMHFEVAKII
jgi:hypothetical protein